MRLEMSNDNGGGSFTDLQKKFAKILGTKKVSKEVFIRAIEEPIFGIELVLSKNASDTLNELLSDKKNEKYKEGYINNHRLTKSELIKKATNALMLWSKVGFHVVSNEKLKKREDICLNCPNLTAPYDTLQKIIPSGKRENIIGKRLGNSVCGLCGCNLKNKIRLSSESCPQADPEHKGSTRWGD